MTELSEVTEEVFIVGNPVQYQQVPVYMNFWKFGREEQRCESLHRLALDAAICARIVATPGFIGN
jgi:hypothetical protein